MLLVNDFFSGCGGLSQGFKEAGFKIQMAVDKEEAFLKTFSHNFENSRTKNLDLGDESVLEQIPKADIIIAGPPCQGFSLTGPRNIEDPRNKLYLRKKYNLPLDKKIILFSAQDINDERKGYYYFKKILTKLSKNDNFYFLSMGNTDKGLDYFKNYKHLKYLSNNRTAEIFSLSDIYLCTSIIDNLPLTVLEALSSGNLVISFKNGGATEVLKNLGKSFRISDINKLIMFIKNLNNSEIKKYSRKSRKFALKNFNQDNTKKQYQKIFKTIHNLKLK